MPQEALPPLGETGKGVSSIINISPVIKFLILCRRNSFSACYLQQPEDKNGQLLKN